MYDRSQKVIESLERLKLLMSVMFAFPNQMLLPIIRCPRVVKSHFAELQVELTVTHLNMMAYFETSDQSFHFYLV